jgi:hypothetical protein
LAGRLVAVALMVVGIAFTGIVSAALVSVFLRRTEIEVDEEDRKFEERVRRAVQAELAPLQERLEHLTELVERPPR